VLFAAQVCAVLPCRRHTLPYSAELLWVLSLHLYCVCVSSLPPSLSPLSALPLRRLLPVCRVWNVRLSARGRCLCVSVCVWRLCVRVLTATCDAASLTVASVFHRRRSTPSRPSRAVSSARRATRLSRTPSGPPTSSWRSTSLMAPRATKAGSRSVSAATAQVCVQRRNARARVAHKCLNSCVCVAWAAVENGVGH
jgi:hypothetical protein